MIKPGFCIGICVAVLIFPATWLISWVCAAVIHELGHYVMLKLLNIRIYSVTIGLGGAVISTAQMTLKEELLCTMAGPLLGFCAMALAKWLPYVAICAFIQNIYNLIPLPQHDGSRLLKCFFRLVFAADVADAAFAAVRSFMLIILLGCCLYLATRLSLGYLFGWFSIALIWKCLYSKIPCKDCKQIVQ